MKRILIIEDDSVIAYIYRTRLERECYTVELCSNGRVGLERAQEFNPDAILLDLMLPEMNGIEFLKNIRAQSRFASIPVVAFTNAYLPTMIQEASAAGASQVYNKSTLTPKELLDCLYFLLHGTRRVSASSSFSEYASGTGLNNNPGNVQPPPANLSSMADEPGTPPSTSSPLKGPIECSEVMLDSELLKAFEAAKPETISALRTLLKAFLGASDEAARDQHLLDLYRKVHSLTARAGLAKFVGMAQISSALEVLLKELHERPSHINVSTVRTVAQSVEFICELFEVCEPRLGEFPAPKVLVVDDDVLSRRAIMYALERGNLESSAIGNPTVALKLFSEERFDLIVLDIQMPGLDGFELCTSIRALPTNQNTPILFVTRLTDFENRAKATMRGGTDFVAKPFFFIEVTIKAVSLILRSRLFSKAKAA